MMRIPRPMFVLMLLTASSLGQTLTKTTTTISSSLNPSTYEQAVTFTATVSPTPPNGETVTFYQGSKTLGTSSLSGGSAKYTISTLTPGGTDNIKATYAGDSTYKTSTSAALPQVVNEATTTTTLVSGMNPANTGQAVTLTATVKGQYGGTPTGNVEFMSNGSKIQQVALSGGVATISPTTLIAGSDSLTALYKGSSDYQDSTSNAISETIDAGTTINTTMTWDGVTRYYMLFVPGVLPVNPPLVMMLHGTHFETPPANPSTMSWGWQTYANEYGFILVQPASTYNENSGAWNWNDYFMSASFTAAESGTCTSPPATACPDDAGFLRQLIVNLTSQYKLNTNQIYVTGFSSGAQMTERVGVEISDLVAAIVPTSGQMEGQQAAPPPVLGPQDALAPISVQEWHGTEDTELPPCNYGTTGYSGVIYYLDTVDDTFNYWVSQNDCSTLQTTQTLCTDDQPTSGLSGNVATGCSGNSNLEVQFIWEDDLGHSWVQKNDPTKWLFMAAHPKQPDTVRKTPRTNTLNLENVHER